MITKVYFSSLHFCPNTQLVKVWWSYSKHAILYQNMYINQTQSVKVWWIYNTSDMNSRQLCIEISKKHNKIKGRSITLSHIWHDNTSKFVYWLDNRSLKVWWSYVLPNTYTVDFCVIIFRHRAMFPSCKKNNIGNQKFCHLRIY